MARVDEPMTPSARFGPVRVYFGSRSGRYPDGNQVIVQGSESRAVFDTPLVSHRIGDDFDQADLVILGHVHEDHTAGVARLPRVPVYVHHADLPAIETWQGSKAAFGYDEETWEFQKRYMIDKFNFVLRPDATGYEDGEVWDLGGGVSIRAVHMPGHTAGHCVLLVEPPGLAFLGDIELSSFGPYYGDSSSSLAETRRTLKRLPSIPAATWVVSHTRGVYTDRAALLCDLQAYEDKIGRRERRILNFLGEQPQSLEDLVAYRVLWPRGYEAPWVDATERNTIREHLDELLGDGRVKANEDFTYSLA